VARILNETEAKSCDDDGNNNTVWWLVKFPNIFSSFSWVFSSFVAFYFCRILLDVMTFK